MRTLRFLDASLLFFQHTTTTVSNFKNATQFTRSQLPARLEEEWKGRHREGAEKAFEEVERQGQAVGGASFFAKAEEVEEEGVEVGAVR